MDRKYLEAIATLVGTIIGAGVLGIPYVVAKSGIKIGLVHILLLGIAILFINLYVAEISLRTKKTHQ
ncbi:MAG: aromatic amino acid transport family protein, partial [Nanoarchaeota archaeon]